MRTFEALFSHFSSRASTSPFTYWCILAEFRQESPNLRQMESLLILIGETAKSILNFKCQWSGVIYKHKITGYLPEGPGKPGLQWMNSFPGDYHFLPRKKTVFWKFIPLRSRFIVRIGRIETRNASSSISSSEAIFRWGLRTRNMHLQLWLLQSVCNQKKVFSNRLEKVVNKPSAK